MRFRLSLVPHCWALFSVLTVHACRLSDNEGSQVKIFNGARVLLEDAVSRHTVAMISGVPENYQIYCTGTLIGENTVMTAAHCVRNPAQALTVAMGAGYLEADKVVFRTGLAKVHPDFATLPPFSYTVNDLAIVELQDQLSNPPHMRPVKLGSAEDITVGTEVILAGYGVLGVKPFSGPVINLRGFLYQTTTRIQEIDTEKANMIVYSSDNKLNSACNGDSGGPMFKAMSSGELVLLAATRGPVITDPNSMKCQGRGTYTNIVDKKDWVESL